MCTISAEQIRKIQEEAVANAGLVQKLAAQLSVHNCPHIITYVANPVGQLSFEEVEKNLSRSHPPKHENQKLKYPASDKVSKRILEYEARSVSHTLHPRIEQLVE